MKWRKVECTSDDSSSSRIFASSTCPEQISEQICSRLLQANSDRMQTLPSTAYPSHPHLLCTKINQARCMAQPRQAGRIQRSDLQMPLPRSCCNASADEAYPVRARIVTSTFVYNHHKRAESLTSSSSVAICNQRAFCIIVS